MGAQLAGRANHRIVRLLPLVGIVGVLLLSSVAAGALVSNPGEARPALFSGPLVHPVPMAPRPAAYTGPGNWTEQTDYGAASGTSGTGGISVLGPSCVGYNGTVYCVGGQNSSGVDLSHVFYSQFDASGNLGSWNETTDYGATSGTSGTGGMGIEFSACVTDLGYIYCVAGALSGAPYTTSKVYFAALGSSGIGPWTETTDYGATSGTSGAGGISTFQLGCAAVSGYIYCAGSGSSKVYYAPLSSSGVGAWTETTDYGAGSGSSGNGGVKISNPVCSANGTDIYCVGGTVSFVPVSDVFYAPVSSSGVGAWTQTIDYGGSTVTNGTTGVPIYGTTCFMFAQNVSANLTCVAGATTGNVLTSGVYYAQVGPTGVSGWTQSGGYAALPQVPVGFEKAGVPRGWVPQRAYQLSCVTTWSGYYLPALCVGGGSSQTYSAPLIPIIRLITKLSANTVPQGQYFTDQATLIGAAQPAGGTVTYRVFEDGHCTAGGYPVKVTVTLGIVPPMPAQDAPGISSRMSVLASYSGDGINPPVTAACEPLNVSGPTITTHLSAASVAAGQTFYDSATMTGTLGTPSGIVTYTFYPNGGCDYPIGESNQTLTATGTIPDSDPITASVNPTGFMSVDAEYFGDVNNLPSLSACEVIPVGQAQPTLTTQLSPSAVYAGQPFTDSATLEGATSDAGGGVLYRLYSDGNCANSTGSTFLANVTNGAVQSSNPFTAVASPTGFNSILAKYGGDASNAPTKSACETIKVTTPAPTTTHIDCSPGGFTTTGSTTCTVSVSGGSDSFAGQTVTLVSSSPTGKFTPNPCTLTAANYCLMTYEDSVPGTPILSAAFGGNLATGDAPSAGSTIVGVGTPAMAPIAAQASNVGTGGGSASADQTSTTKVAIAVTGSSAADGTAAVLFSEKTAQAAPGTPDPTLSNVLGSFDVKIAGITDGTARICVTSTHVDSRTVLEYVAGGAWTDAGGLAATPGSKVCGNVPVSGLQGTAVSGGDTSGSPAGSTTQGTELVLIVVVVVGVAALAGLLFWRARRGRSSGPPPPAP